MRVGALPEELIQVDMTFSGYVKWRGSMKELSARVGDHFETRYGYPPGENVVRGPTDDTVIERVLRDHAHAIPDELVTFYREVSEISLPDVHVGYFICSVQWVIQGVQQGNPVRLGGSWDTSIVTFGSDGGGTLFALGTPRGEPVYALPPGPVRDQVYDDSATPAHIIADDLREFLMRLHDTVVAFLQGSPAAGRYLS